LNFRIPRIEAFSFFFGLAAIILVVWLAAGGAAAETAVCGNAALDPGETCDDGNITDGDGCSATCAVEQDCFDDGNVFSFFSWSDTYPGMELALWKLLEDAVDSVRYPTRVIPRLWISPGDTQFLEAADGLLDAANDAISDGWDGDHYPFDCPASNGKFPYFVALGNHDVDSVRGVPNRKTFMQKLDYWKNYIGPRLPNTLVGIRNFRWGPPTDPNAYDYRTTYSFDYKNAHFVIVNQYHIGTPDAEFQANPIACIRPDLYAWIDQDLSATDRPVRFLFGHEPAWSYCSNVEGSGGQYCPPGHPDNLDPPRRPRPYSQFTPWPEDYGKHWGDSLEDSRCPPGSRDAFWAMLAQHNVVAHFTGHVHTYSSRLVEGDGTRRNDLHPYYKTGNPDFDSLDGVWEIAHGTVTSSAGSVYVLTTVQNNTVTFEAYDTATKDVEPFHLMEKWTVVVKDNNLTLAAFAANFGRTDCPGACAGTMDGDGDVDGKDLFNFIRNLP
jgi:cysteine-rich repeat protein